MKRALSILHRFTAYLEGASLRTEALWVSLPIILYLLSVGTAATLRHLSFYTGYDLAVFDQVVWNTSQGDWFDFSLEYKPITPAERISFLGNHFTPILLLFAFFYRIVPSPLTLLWGQAIFLALGGIPVYWLARQVLRSRALGILFLLLYLTYPPLREIALFDFHPIAFCIPLLLTAFCFLHYNRLLPFLFFLALALTTKEEITLVIFILGIYILLVKKNLRLGLILSVAGLALFFIEISLLIPYFRGGTPYKYLVLYSSSETPPSNIITLLFTHWQEFIGRFLAHIPNTSRVLSPLGFLPLLSPSHLLLAAPNFAISLLSSSESVNHFISQYPASGIPFLFVAAIFGLRNLIAISSRLRPFVPLGVMALIAYSFWTTPSFGPIYGFWQPERMQAGQEMVYHIPPTGSIMASQTLAPHLTHRRQVFTFWGPLYGFADPLTLPDFIAIDSREPWPFDDISYHIFAGLLEDSLTYTVAYSDPVSGFWLFRRTPLALNPLPKFSGWEKVKGKGTTPSAPAAFLWQGKPWVGVRGEDNRIFVKPLDADLWQQVPGGLTLSRPSLVEYGGMLYIFVRGTDNRTYINRTADGNWQGWEEVPENRLTRSGLAAIVLNKSLHLFVRGMDDYIYLNQFDGTAWSKWQIVPGTRSRSAPAAVAANDKLYLLYQDPKNAVRLHLLSTATTSGLSRAQWIGSPKTIVAYPVRSSPFGLFLAGRPFLFVRGWNHRIYFHPMGLAPVSIWAEISDTAFSSPAALVHDNQLILLIRGGDNAIYANRAPLRGVEN